MPDFIEPDDTRYDDRSRALVSIGRVAIAQENAAALRDYFSEDFAFHSPDGELDFAGLETFFSQMRDAFADYYCERYEIVSNGALIGCRTEMGGVFTAPFEPTPFGTVQPHGRRVTLTLINMFRYDEHGKLAEEWVQYDNLEWMRQLGVTVTPAL
ncbi:SnoaL-like polyketide cyclase [Curtobacterium sp. PhB25]|uniref:ester cyclase n=1 Tax=Curtobacterium sp. PhB25 TaxID=2485205 RepID=UPI00106713C0|nr:ester cyclase [Curtobacterium sp. PhB25]TDW64174.1 SnoaL-like polyketide cyclase [Curtobacterium sp. PhB25]